MSLMINGQLQKDWFTNSSKDGDYVRKDSQFRNWVTADGSAGPSGAAGFAAEKNRYHLYVSLACPWAHRTLIYRELKSLQEIISVSVVHPYMDEKGWSFDTAFAGATGDDLYNLKRMHEIYYKSQPDYSGVVTVPVLWDKKLQCIVNNESSEIIRMFNSAFNGLIDNAESRQRNYYPEELAAEIDEINAFIYNNVNNGVYRTGFATKQASYEKAHTELFDTLDALEERLSTQRYLVGKQLTEADWRLFVTLIRFDPVYVGHFKCSKKRIKDYPNLYHYMLDLYQHEAVAKTVDFEHIKHHYYASHEMINPTRIIPVGPEQDLNQPHNRAGLS